MRRKARSPVEARLETVGALYRDRGVRFLLTFIDEDDDGDVAVQELEAFELLPAE